MMTYSSLCSFSQRRVFSRSYMLQCSLNMNLIAWVVGATTLLPTVPFSRHKDNGLDGCLDGTKTQHVQIHKSHREVWGWSSDAALFSKHDNLPIFQPPSMLLFMQKKLIIMFTVLTRVPVLILMQFDWEMTKIFNVTDWGVWPMFRVAIVLAGYSVAFCKLGWLF